MKLRCLGDGCLGGRDAGRGSPGKGMACLSDSFVFFPYQLYHFAASLSIQFHGDFTKVSPVEWRQRYCTGRWQAHAAESPPLWNTAACGSTSATWHFAGSHGVFRLGCLFQNLPPPPAPPPHGPPTSYLLPHTSELLDSTMIIFIVHCSSFNIDSSFPIQQFIIYHSLYELFIFHHSTNSFIQGLPAFCFDESLQAPGAGFCHQLMAGAFGCGGFPP